MNRSVIAAFAIVAGLSVWMASGMNSQPDDNIHQTTEHAETPPMKVQVMHSTAQPVQRLVSVQGQVEASRVVQLKAEVDGRVEQLPVAEGTRVSTGTPLIKLAEDYRSAQLTEAQARLKKAQSDLRASQKLRKRGLQAENQIIADQAAVESARAQLAQIRYQLAHTRIEAPFAGVLNQRNVELGDFVERGQHVAELVDDKRLIVTGQLPQHYATDLNTDQAIAITLVNGEKLSGTLQFISATANPETRSYRVEVSLDNPEHKRLIGLSATLQLPVAELSGHWVPGSALGLDTTGALQVKTLDANDRVENRTVELIRTDKNGFWISGLPDTVVLINVGQHFVGTGEQVIPVQGTQSKEAQIHARVN